MTALEMMLEKCSTDAQRVTMLREALDLEKAEHLATSYRWLKISHAQKRAIAKARKALRQTEDKGLATFEAYAALDWRNR